MRRRRGPSGIRAEIAAHTERLLSIAVGVGDDAAAASFRERLDAVTRGRPVTGLYGYECGASGPNSGPWTLRADNGLTLEAGPHV